MVVHNGLDRSERAAFAALRQQMGDALQVVVNPHAHALDHIRAALPEVRLLACRNRCDLPAAWRLRRWVREFRPQVLYAPHNHTLAVALQATRGLPVAVIGYRGTIGHISRRDPASWITYLHPRLAHIVCVSDAVRAYLRNDIGIPPQRLTRIYKGHDVAWYDAIAPSQDDLSAFGIPAGARLVGFAGNVRPVKGVNYLIEALDRLPSSTHLLIIGEIRDKQVHSLAATGTRRGRVHNTGWRADAVALMRRCDLLAMPSVAREGLPRAVIEGLAIRKPTVVTNVGGIPEIVLDGVHGLVVPPCDADALGRAIGELLRDKKRAEAMAEAGRQRIERHFDIATMSKALSALFEKVAPSGQAQARAQ